MAHHSLLFLLLVHCVSLVSAEYVGNNDWPERGEIWPASNIFYIMNNNGPQMPDDGYIHAFIAKIKVADVEVRFQIWRKTPNTNNVTLIGEESFVTEESSLAERNTTFYLSRSIEVEQGDRIGFWAPVAIAIARYGTGSFIPSSWLFKTGVEPVVGQTYAATPQGNQYKFSLGVLLEDQPLEVKTTTVGNLNTTDDDNITTVATTTVEVEGERVYGNPGLKGELWKEVELYPYFSIVIGFDPPIGDGYLNNIQMYSVKQGVQLKFQHWRALKITDVKRAFLLVDEFEYTTRLLEAFENTTVWNVEVFDGDLFGVTVTDSNVKGFPIGWERSSGGKGDQVYRRDEQSDGLPKIGVTYTDYLNVGTGHNLAIALFVSDEPKEDDPTNITYPTTTSLPTTTNFFSTTPLTGGVTTTTPPLDSEIVIGNKELVFDNDTKDGFQPFSSVSMALTALLMRRDGEVTELGFYASETLPVEIGIYRPEESEDCSKRSVFTKIYNQTVTASSIGPEVLTLDPPVRVMKCDVLGFYNLNETSLVVGRVGVGGIGDNPYMTIGSTEINQPANYIMYIRGYEYAMYAVLAEVPPTTTTITTTTTTTEPTTTTTEPTTTTTAQTTTTTQVVLIPGEPGDTGSSGDVGPTGSTGPKGVKGPKGQKGTPGAEGESGAEGEPGQPGWQGPQGDKGEIGATGITGVVGMKGSVGEEGVKGDMGISGPTGITGETGDTGSSGTTGAKGLSGSTGSNGAKGQKGEKGQSGDTGPTGEKGAVGEPGPRGPNATLTVVNECEDNTQPASCLVQAHSTCTDTELSFQCGCAAGYEDTNGNCTDVDECKVNNGMCQQNCINTEGSRVCSCQPGYLLSANGRTCVDIDECSGSTDNCTNGEQCFNEVGTYKCLFKPRSSTGAAAVLAEAASNSWLGLILAGLAIWAALLTFVLFIICIVLCVDRKTTNSTKRYVDTYYGSSTNMYR